MPELLNSPRVMRSTASQASETGCRVCGSTLVRALGEVEYLAGYALTVYDCDSCGCRLTRHDDIVYDLLHESGAISYYADYRDLESHCSVLFQQRDEDALRNLLCLSPKYRFIIEHATAEMASPRFLELGCSRGYLTSYFVLQGENILGVDVSAEAIQSARGAFGDHFVVAGSPAIDAGIPYDIVYHMGMIGCVGDPVGLTKSLLSMLKPGGKLLFNAPNRAALHLHEQLWLDSAPPPDVVTLFPEGFWKRNFSSQADVIEGVEMLSAENAAVASLRSLCGRKWRKPLPRPLTSANSAGTWAQPNGRAWYLFERAVRKAARVTHLLTMAPPKPSDFGLYVQMTAR